MVTINWHRVARIACLGTSITYSLTKIVNQGVTLIR